MASFREQAPTERFEKRKMYRFPVQLPAKLGPLDDLSSICTNLSSSGASFETSLPLSVAERVAITVTVSPDEESLRMVGRVIWRRELGAFDFNSRPIQEVGVRFLPPLPTLEKNPDELGDIPMPSDREEEEDRYIFPRRI